MPGELNNPQFPVLTYLPKPNVYVLVYKTSRKRGPLRGKAVAITESSEQYSRRPASPQALTVSAFRTVQTLGGPWRVCGEGL